jgi:organic radical activating enzyme
VVTKYNSSPLFGALETFDALPIVETFHSIQGEGFWTGTNAFFIRLAGCDVGCPWCDTKQSWSARHHPQRLLTELVAEAVAAQPKIVIVTGGEPLMHNLDPLTQALHTAGLTIHLETSGSHPWSGEFDWVTFSPKPFKQPNPSIYAHVNELKVVIASASDFEWAQLQAQKVAEGAIKCLQPEWTDPDNRSKIVEFVMQNPSWRISLQTHKMLGVR